VPLFTGQEKAPDSVVFQEVMYEGPTVRKAVVTERWHLIQNLIPDGTTELYDLKADPGETHDLDGQEPKAEAALSARLAEWLDDSAVPQNFAKRVANNLSAAPLSGALPVGARIGDFLDVVAADVPLPQIGRGEGTEVAVVYKVRRRIPAGYRLFVHLRGSTSAMMNLDHDFIEGLVPPQRLLPGMYVRDVTRLAIPTWFPLGKASLYVGLYRQNTRVEVEGPDGVALRSDRSVRTATLEIR
jgi:hypothetical protein